MDEDFQVVLDRKMIAKKYIKGWFIIDLLAVIPFEFILSSSNTDINGLVRFARIGRMYKMVKLARLVRIIKLMKEDSTAMKFIGNVFNDGAGFNRLFLFVLMFLAICHFTACLWLIIA